MCESGRILGNALKMDSRENGNDGIEVRYEEMVELRKSTGD